jgi:hypothetical protein
VVDVYGSLLALRALGVEKVYVSPLAVGEGCVMTRHGELPNPAPGTSEILRGHQLSFEGGKHELTTPTGAAILTVVGTQAVPPPITAERIGYGAGTRETGQRPNLLRVFVGAVLEEAGTEEVCQVETVIDDMSPQLVEVFLKRAYQDGALEAWVTPVQMKRSRPGMALTALANPERLDAVIRAFLEETSTLGVRVSRLRRVRLDRRMVRLRTRFGTLSFKLAGTGAMQHAVPEFREVERLARRARVPTRLVLEEARGMWNRFKERR